MRRINADFLCPNIKGFVVVLIDRNVELVLGHFENLGEEFPRPCGSLALKIISEREVAEHFKECAVTRGDTYALDIGRSDTLLAGGNALARRSYLACEVLFHGSHTAVDKQKAVVVLWNERKAGQSETAL